MRNITGQVARGADFYDRQGELSQFWDALKTDNLLLLAPRRVGKTSIMRRMQDLAADQSFSAVFVDVSDCTDEAAFIKRLYEAILSTNLGSRFWSAIEKSTIGQIISRTQKVGGYGFNVEFKSPLANWAQAGEQLAEALNTLEGNWLLEVDELPVFLLKLFSSASHPQQPRLREFLYWLRRLRLENPEVRWILAGSIGLDTVAARINISDSINDLKIVTVGAFTPSTADSFLQSLAASYNCQLSQQARTRILDRIGWLAPYYLQLAFQQIRNLPSPSVDDVDRAINALLEPQFRTHFDYWRQRLSLELDEADASHASAILNTCARDPEGTSRAVLSATLTLSIPDARQREDRLRYLLDVLENDGYLVQQGPKYRFRFALLREFWLRRVAPPEDLST